MIVNPSFIKADAGKLKYSDNEKNGDDELPILSIDIFTSSRKQWNVELLMKRNTRTKHALKTLYKYQNDRKRS